MELRKPAMSDTDTIKILGDAHGTFKGYFMVRCYTPSGERAFPFHPGMTMDMPTVRIDIDQATYPTDVELLAAMRIELISMGHTIEGD